MSLWRLARGESPLVIDVPHAGTDVPDAIAARMTAEARTLPDTDWHVEKLYAFARETGATLLVATHSRYVVDLNRPPDDVSLYPGQNTTGLCPIVRFSGDPVYLPGQEPTPDEVAARVDTYWRPYHEALRGELDRLRTQHGRVLLWEGHSIRGECPFLFDGRLPDLNIGTAAGASCSPASQARIEAALQAQQHYDWVLNGRFKGGYITRHYGDPANGIDAVQLEISQRIYMDEDSFAYDDALAASAARAIRALIEAALRTDA